MARRAAREDGPRQSAQPPAVRALRRPAAARRNLARPRDPPDDPLRRRAHRKPRLEDERRDSRAPARLDRVLRADDRHGHARTTRSRDRRPRPLPRRRADREGAARREPGRRARRHEQPELMLRVALPDVNAAEGSVTDDQTKLVGRDDKVISTHGAGSLALSINPDGDQRFNPLKLTAGHWPRGPDEIAVSTNVASNKSYEVGDTIGAQKNGPVQQFRIAGIVTLPGVSIGSATLAVVDLPPLHKPPSREGQ